MRAIIQVLFIAFVLGFMPYGFYTLGHKVASYTIAKQCANNNTFTEHGNVFHCYDLDDYAAR